MTIYPTRFIIKLGDNMETFMNNFSIFFNKLFEGVQTFWNWYISTIIGQITIFTLLIALFFFVVNLFVDWKD